jgi:hypothetical protein
MSCANSVVCRDRCAFDQACLLACAFVAITTQGPISFYNHCAELLPRQGQVKGKVLMLSWGAGLARG